MAITIYPAIDLKDGNCVRLLKGDMNAATIYNENPVAQAKAFADAGAKWLHIVDLDGAIQAKSFNREAVKSILEGTDLKIQLGGGIRDLKSMETWLDRGVSRLILGTLALKSPEIVKEACKEFPGRIAVGIDARGGKVAIEGWSETTSIKATDLAQQFEQSGVSAIIYTDIDRDGTLTGVNLSETHKLADTVSIPVIASGGVAGTDDLQAIFDGGTLEGVIVGKALYSGQIDLKFAIRHFSNRMDTDPC